MSRIGRRSWVSAVAFALAVSVTGCAGGGDEATEAGHGPSALSAPQTTTPAPTLEPLMPGGTGAPFEDLRTAASHMLMTAAALAAGIVEGAVIDGDSASPAAELRSTLTALLTEHVYLSGIAVATAYATAPNSAEFQAAAAALDKNSVAVADAVGSIVPDQRDTFLDAWRAHIGDFVSYAVAVKGRNDEATAKEAADLAAYTQSQGAFFEQITGGALPAADATASLNEHVATFAGAVDALAAGDTGAFDLLKTAGDHMAMSAEALAAGIVSATETEGDPSDDAAALRSGLTSQLVSHVYLAGVSVFAAYTAGAESAEFRAAAAALDENSADIAARVGSVAPDQEMTFLDQWRSHISDFVDYALAAAASDEAGKQQQLDDLNAYRASAGEFFSDLTGGALAAADVAEVLGHHAQTLAGAIDSFFDVLVDR
jgi:hypothetical protein